MFIISATKDGSTGLKIQGFMSAMSVVTHLGLPCLPNNPECMGEGLGGLKFVQRMVAVTSPALATKEVLISAST